MALRSERATGPPRDPCTLTGHDHVVAVTAHPDDESFGLGALIALLDEEGSSIGVLCFTRGEASELGAGDTLEAGNGLGDRREAELSDAAGRLGVREVKLLAYPDGALSQVDLEELSEHVKAVAGGASALLAFDTGGITGHPDHVRATCAALWAARDLKIPVIAWAIEDAVAERLNAEFKTSFAGRPTENLVGPYRVSRDRQLDAMRCHPSQLEGNAVPLRRLELQGSDEYVRCVDPWGADAERCG